MSKAKAATLVATDQEAFLRECQKRVQTEAFYMKRSMDNGKLFEALKHASNMVGQLRTGLLSPQHYYELYISTFNQLHHLRMFLEDERAEGDRMSHLYELVQYAGNILPRLYLLITVGVVYVGSREAPAKDILKDLVEMCKGVQHPLRGLFLRHYLSEMTKDRLPDLGSPYHGAGGDVADCVDFVQQNFAEMNKLWVRMQHQGSTSDQKRRERERSDLRLLVGTNLARLSQLEGVDVELYKESVLPHVLNQIVSCKDVLAQQYLAECVIQVFPDEYHLQTLDRILETCAQLQRGVDLKAVIVALIDRLAAWAGGEEGRLGAVDVFSFFYKHLAVIIRERPDMPVQDTLELVVALLHLTLQFYPDNLEYVDRLLVFCADALDQLKEKGAEVQSAGATKQLARLLNTPLEEYKNVLTVLQLEHYPRVMAHLPWAARKRVAVDIAKSAVANQTRVPSAHAVNRLFEFIAPLIQDQADQPPADEVDEEDFEEEQQLVGSLVHLFERADLKELSAMYVTARTHFGQGASTPPLPQRIKYTLPPLIFAALDLADNLKQEELIAKKVFKFVHETITALSKHDQPELSLNLFLHAALTANNCGFEQIAYEFVTKAFVTYEDSVTESRAQFRAMELFVGAVQQMSCFDADNYEAIITKTALHSSRLLLKPDQCRAVYKCSHLFWSEKHRDGKRVLECLQKALKIADACMETDIHLFIEILNEYLYYYTHGNEAITVQYLNGLIALINTNMDNKEVDDASDAARHYRNTLAYIRHLQRRPDLDRPLDGVDIPER